MVADLNLDLGELEGADGRARELALLPYATRINVACGFHAGDEETMRALCAAARQHRVLVGAHIAYRDREHFGRRALAVDPATLAAEASEQLRVLTAVSEMDLSHVKPHGALYHHLGADQAAADAVAAAIADHDQRLAVVTQPGSALAAAAVDHGLHVLREGFADRAYDGAGRLRPRSEPGALLAPAAAAAQARTLAASGTVDTICVHGDGPEALATVRAVREALGA